MFLFVTMTIVVKIDKSKFMSSLLIVVAINFLAQVLYYYHQYYSRRKLLPSLLGIVLLSFVLTWFVIGYTKLQKNKRYGYSITLSFVIVEFLFYLQTQIVQALSGSGVLLHVLHPDDTLLFVVFLIGYINFIASGWFSYFMIKNRRLLSSLQS